MMTNTKVKRPLILTCSLCANFEPDREICKLSGESREGISQKYASTCKNEGKFIRYMNVLPDVYNYYNPDEKFPERWEIDKSRLPKDEKGYPIYVSTSRGVERVIPANELTIIENDSFSGVPPIMTYQGQRTTIYRLGIEIAKEEAEKLGVKLTILPEEEGWPGIEKFKQKRIYQKEMRKRAAWLNEEANVPWK